MKCDKSGSAVDVIPAGDISDYGGGSGAVFDTIVLSSVLSSNSSPVRSVTLHPGSSIVNSNVNRVVLCSNSSIESAIVRDSYVMSHSEVSDNALVSSCIVGPDCHLACGESHNSLLGPCTVSHHQSLAISHISPGGRTNMGYGANVGSNHTGRLPDAEFWNGEGVFIGLAAVVKLSCDFVRSYYSLVAAGTAVNSGVKVTCPFSLLTSNSKGENEVRPGWVLYSSPYTVARAANKFKTRTKAKEHRWYSAADVFRTGVLEGMRLQIGSVGEGSVGVKIVHGGRGEEAYKNFLKMVCLEGLLAKLEGSGGVGRASIALKGAENPLGRDAAAFPWMEPKDPWQYHKFCLSTLYSDAAQEGELQRHSIASMLSELLRLHASFVRNVEKSKAKDDARGKHITGYQNVHPPASSDKVVNEWKEINKNLYRRVARVLGHSVSHFSKL